jgi:hypothetical protein
MVEAGGIGKGGGATTAEVINGGEKAMATPSNL